MALIGALAALLVPTAADAATPTTLRMSLTSGGQQADAETEYPTVSQNGQYIAFSSRASNLVPGDTNGVHDVFLRDRRAGTLRRISIGAEGQQGDADSQQPSMSADGRWIAFTTAATNLIAGATGGYAQVLLYDQRLNRLIRLNNVAGGTTAGGGPAYEPQVSADGSVVVFSSLANDLVPGDGARKDIFLYRIASRTLERVSAKQNGMDANDDASTGAASAGGRYVVFSRSASDLVRGDSNALEDVFVHDTTDGSTRLMSVNTAGVQGNARSRLPSISADGCHVAFVSSASNLVATDDGSLQRKAFVRDRCASTTEFASLTSSGAQGGVATRRPSISDDGCLVAMISRGDNVLVPAGAWRASVLRDRCRGTTERMDVSSAGVGGTGHTDGISLSAGSGRYVVFHAGAQDLVSGDSNGFNDVFVRDRGNATPPIAQLQVNASGRTVTANAGGSSDPDGDIESIRIAFGDGSAPTMGAMATHTYARAGRYEVTSTVTDIDGLVASVTRVVNVHDEPGSGPGTGTHDPDRLTISRLRLSRSRFAVVRRGRRVGSAGGATLRVASNGKAKLTLRFQRVLPGRRRGKSCSLRARSGRRCTALKTVGELRVTVRAGTNRIPLTGRLRGGRALPRGSYRLRLSARAADGRTSAARSVRLRIVNRTLHRK